MRSPLLLVATTFTRFLRNELIQSFDSVLFGTQFGVCYREHDGREQQRT